MEESLYIEYDVDKNPYIKKITDDRVINITGESGGGKSYYSKRYDSKEGYIVIDTDVVFSDKCIKSQECVEVRKLFLNDTKQILTKDFDRFYKGVLELFKDREEMLVIDSACFINIKDLSLLKGEIVIIRTSALTSYQRILSRWRERNPNATDEEYQEYAQKKKYLFSSYTCMNYFIEKIEELP